MSNSGESSKGKSSSGKKPASKTGFSALPIAVFVVGAGILIWLISSSFKSSPGTPADGAQVDTPVEQGGDRVEPESVAANDDQTGEVEPLSDADRQKLLGRWERTDNPPYSIEIRLVQPDGVTDARYFNPRPINVEQGVLVARDGKLAFFMRMNDVGYQGSTYTLVYDESQDMLVGEYFQATMGQTFEVAFTRASE